jgi:hypothetical protein
MRRPTLFALALLALLLLAFAGATAQALRGERPLLLGGW